MNYLIFLPNRKARHYWIDILLSCFGIILLMAGSWLPSMLVLLMALLGYLIRRKQYIEFSDSGVKVHMVWVKKYEWKEFNAVMLKDGMLTLDFTNNKLFQQAICSGDPATVEEDRFNIDCAKKIDSSRLVK